MQTEIWKSIEGYKEYSVSNLGRIKSFKCKKEIIIKIGISSNGYQIVRLSENNKIKTRTVHQLVSVAFLDHSPCGMKLVIDHIDDNKLNNKVENLQIVTARYNACKTQGNYSSKYKGVYWCANANKWRAVIQINYKKKHLGLFETETEASNAYQLKLKEL